jgi:hypothetical protein
MIDLVVNNSAPVPGRWSRFKAALKAGFAACVKFAAGLIDRSNPAIDLQLLAFAIFFPFSVYWLQTRPNPSTGWCTCFGIVWGAVALKDIFHMAPRSGGDGQ